MDERENLPAKLAAQGLAATIERRGSLVGRGMAAVLSNAQLALMKGNDALYRQARELYDHISNSGNQGVLCFGFTENQMMNAFHQLATENYGKAYFPLYTLHRGWQSIKADPAQSLHYLNLATDWLLDNQHLNDPEIWHDLGALYVGNDADLAIHWFQKAAEVGDASSMWELVGAYEYKEDWGNALHWQIKAAKAGHKEAQHGLVQQHEHGDLETKLGDEQVFDWYVWSAEQGCLWAQMFLAFAFRCGDLIEQDDEQAAHWYLLAATQGEPHAQLQLGKMYWEGRGVEQDYDQAEYWLENSADQGSAESQYQFGQFLCEKGSEEEKAGQLIQCAADQEYGPAQYVIASDIGFFDVSDEQCAELFDKALTWYEAEAKFDPELRLDLAFMHLDSWQAPYNKSRRANRFDGLRLLEEVASEPLVIDSDNGGPSSKNDAQRRASRRLGNELLKHPNAAEVVKAIHWLEQAADLGDADVCVDLAELYLRGSRRFDNREPQAELVEINLQAAVCWYERGIQLGWSTAAYKLGSEYLYGKQLPQNLALAEKWLLQAAHAGHGSAQLVLGQEYASGARLRQDADAAIYWLKLSAVHSKSTGLKLAEIYLDGKIVPRNFDEAIKWLNLAADGVFRNQAMKLAAEKCAGGQFSATEVVATQAWLVEMAAQAYETVSDEKYPAREAINAFDLGELYELGLGVEPDMEEAVALYIHAAELGNQKAQTRLDELGIDWENT